MVEQLYSQLSNVKSKSPILLLDKAVDLFKQNYSKDIISLKDINIQEYINQFDYKKQEITIIDINNSCDTSVLKCFLKKLKTPIILLSEDTDFDDDLILSVKTIIKYPKKIKSNLLGASHALDMWKDEEDKSDIINFCTKESPELYYLKNKVTMNKYIDLLSRGD